MKTNSKNSGRESVKKEKGKTSSSEHGFYVYRYTDSSRRLLNAIAAAARLDGHKVFISKEPCLDIKILADSRNVADEIMLDILHKTPAVIDEITKTVSDCRLSTGKNVSCDAVNRVVAAIAFCSAPDSFFRQVERGLVIRRFVTQVLGHKANLQCLFIIAGVAYFQKYKLRISKITDDFVFVDDSKARVSAFSTSHVKDWIF